MTDDDQQDNDHKQKKSKTKIVLNAVLAIAVIAAFGWSFLKDQIGDAGSSYASSDRGVWNYGCEHDSFENTNSCTLEFKGQGFNVHFVEMPPNGLAFTLGLHESTHVAQVAFKAGDSVRRFNCIRPDYGSCSVGGIMVSNSVASVLLELMNNNGGVMRIDGNDGVYDYQITANRMRLAVQQLIANKKQKNW